jgi:hypothetical protein
MHGQKNIKFSLSVHCCVFVEHVDAGQSPEAKYCWRQSDSHTKVALYAVVQYGTQ